MQTTHFSCRLENQDLLSSPLTLPLKFYYLTEEEEYVLSQLVSTTQKGVIPMSQVIAIVNQKGGVAKTTTTVNLAAALVQQDERTLCVDLDPQANLTMSLGCQNPDELPYTIADVIDKVIAEKTSILPRASSTMLKASTSCPPPSSFPGMILCSSMNMAGKIC